MKWRRPEVEGVLVTMVLPHRVDATIDHFLCNCARCEDYAVSFEGERTMVLTLLDTTVWAKHYPSVIPEAVMRAGFIEGPQSERTEVTCVGFVSRPMLTLLQQISSQGTVEVNPRLPNASVPRSADGSVWWDGVNWVPFTAGDADACERFT